MQQDFNLKDKFHAQGKSYAVAARQMGVSKTALINAVVHGKFPSRHSSDFKQKLSDYLGCSIAHLDINQSAPSPNLNHQDKETDMLLRKSKLTMQTLRHFGLNSNPFDDEITSSDDIFKSDDVRYVREYLYNTANHGGVSGSGGRIWCWQKHPARRFTRETSDRW